MTLRTVSDVEGYPVVQGMGYSQLLVFWVVRCIEKVTVGIGKFFVNLGGEIVVKLRNTNVNPRSPNSHDFHTFKVLQKRLGEF